jgi:hypothetical protein
MLTIAGGIFLFFALVIGGVIVLCIPFWIAYGIKCILDDWKRMIAKDEQAYRQRRGLDPPRRRKIWIPFDPPQPRL